MARVGLSVRIDVKKIDKARLYAGKKGLPEGKSMFLTKFTKRKGLVKVELDFHWIRNNTWMYEKLMGRR
jgi:hypothetical protein